MITPEIIEFVKRQASSIAFNAPKGLIDRDELFSVGEYALVLSLERWNRSFGKEFKFYALQRTRGAMLDYLRSIDPTPRRTRTRIKQLAQEGDGELSKKDKRIVSKHRTLIYVDSMEESNSFIDRSLSSNGTGVKEELKRDYSRVLPELLTLNPIEQFIVWQHRVEDVRLKPIGAFIGLTMARVQQIEVSALKKLRKKLDRV